MTEKPPITALSQDIQNIEREYRKNVTVVTTRPRLVEAFFLAWGAVVAIMIMFFIATVGWYGVQGIFQDSAYKNTLLANSGMTHARATNAAPAELLVGSVQSVATGSGGKYDLYVQIENPNGRHAGEFTYVFTHADGKTEEKKGFLSPGEKAHFIAARATTGKPKDVALELSNITWIYLAPQEVPNVSAWYSERAAFSVADVVFARDIAYTDATVSRTTFSVTNHTPYSYWEPAFTVQIFRGSILLGITEITAAKFKAGEKRTIDLRWFGELPQTATVTVTPRIPYFEKRAYMNPEASSVNDARNRWTAED